MTGHKKQLSRNELVNSLNILPGFISSKLILEFEVKGLKTPSSETWPQRLDDIYSGVQVDCGQARCHLQLFQTEPKTIDLLVQKRICPWRHIGQLIILMRLGENMAMEESVILGFTPKNVLNKIKSIIQKKPCTAI